MKTSLDWLNSYLDRPATLEEAANGFTALGFPTEHWDAVPDSAGAFSGALLPGAGLPGAGAGAGDWAMEVEVTSNRPDCLCHLGLARDFAAATGRGVRPPVVKLTEHGSLQVQKLTSVQNEAPDLCPVYTARVIKGVKVGPSPAWLVRRLEAVGMRSVNNVVDATNFVMLEMGQPLHAFDMARLAEQRIVVRQARRDEPFVAIDGSQHKLQPPMLVIADARRPVAVAGVMGGLESEVGPATKDVLLESARFDPLSIRKTSRALKLMSDSSYRFERGIDPRGVELASRRAAQLMVELAGGTLAGGVIRAGEVESEPRTVSMRVARCNLVLGLDVPAQRMVELLQRLGLEPRLDAGKGEIACTIPTYRLDLEREIDLVEEIARLHGLDQVPVRGKITINVRPEQPIIAARRRLRQVLTAHGYFEAVNPSMLAERLGRPFLPAGREALLVDDDRRKTEPMLRPSLLPSLLICRKTNQDVGNAPVRLFETAAVWSRTAEKSWETQRLGVLADAEEPGAALRDLRGAIEELVSVLGGEAGLSFQAAEHANLASAATVLLGGKAVGVMGLLAPTAQRLFDLQTAVVVAELDLEPLLALYPPRRKVRTLPRFPAVERDLSLIVREDVAWQQIQQLIERLKPALLEELRFIGVYRGKPIEGGHKSVSLRLVFRDPAATLRGEQVDRQVAQIVQEAATQLGAKLRT